MQQYFIKSNKLYIVNNTLDLWLLSSSCKQGLASLNLAYAQTLFSQRAVEVT